MLLLWSGLAALLTGCELNDFFNPGEPKIIAPNQKPLVIPVLDSLASGIEGPDAQFADATDVTPADLVPDVSDYKIGPDDTLDISIYDLLGEGTGEQKKTTRVTETGSISLPFIPPLKAAGLTEHQLEQSVSQAYQDAQLINKARVSVTVVDARARLFIIQGNVHSPGEYLITRPDFRVLDALVSGGSISVPQGVKYLYIIRQNPSTDQTTTPASENNQNSPGQVTPPASGPMTQPGDLLAPPPTGATPTSAPPGPQGRANPLPSHRVMLMDAFAGNAAPPAAPFKFDDVQTPTDFRTIRIPIQQLRDNGELKFNAVIRPHDMIIVPQPVQGYYYVGGHVLHPGVYQFNGNPITLKNAWITAGGPDDLTIPERTEVVRRVGANREVVVRVDLAKILAMQQPDIYLRPDDTVYVGTQMLAPFLAAARNAFTLIYGGDFLYDRNFYSGFQSFQQGGAAAGGLSNF